MKYKKQFALCMIFLVVSLIVQSSLVFASLSVTVSGIDGIAGVATEEDAILFTAVASLEGDQEITKDQVVFAGLKEFDSCAPDPEGFSCITRFPASGTKRWDPGPIPYTVSLKDDGGKIQNEISGTIYIDNKAPVVESVTVDQSLVNSGTVQFKYTVTDSACSLSSCAGECAGIHKVEFYDVGTGSFAQTELIDSTSCSISRELGVSTLKFTEGEHTVVLKAFDKLGHASLENAVTFVLDKTAPFIDVGSFKIAGEVDVDLDFFGPSAVPMTVSIKIKDDDLRKDTVKADLTQIGGTTNMLGTCTETVDSLTICEWNINYDVGGAGSKTVIIEASDSTGNNARANVVREFFFDNNGPSVVSLESTHKIDSQSFAKFDDNSFIGVFDDESGVSPSAALLEAEGLLYSADTCVPKNSRWECRWDGVRFLNPGTREVSIVKPTRDRVGNELQEEFSTRVIVDANKPKVLEIIITGVGGTNPIEGAVKTGDSIFVEAVIEDEYIDRSVADFSKFILGATEVESESCTNVEDGVFVCTWNVGPIDIPGFIDSTIHFTFTDVAGNAVKTSRQFTSYATDGQAEGDFWTHEVVCSPKLLDRQVFELSSQRAFCRIFLQPNELGTFGDIVPVAVDLDPCEGDVSFIEEVKIFNNDIGNTEPFIDITFRKQIAGVNEINLLCPLSIVTKNGDTIVLTPEKEPVGITFEFYNLPLGEISSSVQEKIDVAIEDATGLLSIIGTLKDLLTIAEQICGLVNVIANIVQVFQKIGTGAEGLGLFTAGTFNQLLCHNTENAYDANVKFLKFAEPFCNFANCKYSPPEGNFDSGYLNWIDEWQDFGYQALFDFGGGEIIEEFSGRSVDSYMNPKGSIVLSTLTGCIPGIVYGLDKYRQIQCLYADCLEVGVGEQGLPVYVCEDQKGYATCKYIVGEIFQVIPFTAFFDHYVGKLRSLMSDPFEILGAALSFGCRSFCAAPTEAPHAVCILPKIAQMIGASIQDISGIIDGELFTVKDDYCDQLEERHAEDPSEESGEEAHV